MMNTLTKLLMKKLSTTVLAVIFTAGLSYAQSNTFPSSGNVGIATTSPQTKLHVYQAVPDATGLIIQGNTINVDQALHYIAMTLDGDYGNGTGNYSQLRSYSNLYDSWGSQLAFYTTQGGIANTLMERMRINDHGNVGIGTTSPSTLLHLYKAGGNSTITMERPDNTAEAGTVFRTTALQQFYLGARAVDGADNFHIFSYQKTGGGADVLNIDKEGNVGIGTTIPDEKLTINGTVHTREVRVDLLIYPDYVFKSTYHLPTLTEVKTYIDQNHHLPDMPTEAEVVKNGLKVGETEALLTKKVEELTLYLIRQKEETDKEITELKLQISTLKRHKK
jgi:hypothetical protein